MKGEGVRKVLLLCCSESVDENDAGVVPVPVAAIIDGSACRSSHSMVWPSDL